MVAELATAALICLDPGHQTVPAVARRTEPIGPGSVARKLVDGGGARGEAAVALAIAQRTRALLRAAGYRVAMTRGARPTTLTNAGRARYCNARHAALMLRIHADGSASSASRGVETLYPAFHRGWTDDIFTASLRAARGVQSAVIGATGARDLGVTPRADLTGFNWADVPAILVETGFLSNPVEGRLLHSGVYQQQIARGLATGVAAFVRP